MMYAVNLALVLFLVFANAFFVVSEFAIVKIRRTKLEELAHAGKSQAKIALKITEHLNTYLSAIQLGITLASLGLGWIGEPAVSRLLEMWFAGFFNGNTILLHSVSFGVALRLSRCCTLFWANLCRSLWLFSILKNMYCPLPGRCICLTKFLRRSSGFLIMSPTAFCA